MKGNLVSNFDLVKAVKENDVTVTRTKTCDWCGATATERIFRFSEDKSYYPRFTESGFGYVVVHGSETKPEVYTQFMLCPDCVGELKAFLEQKVPLVEDGDA